MKITRREAFKGLALPFVAGLIGIFTVERIVRNPEWVEGVQFHSVAPVTLNAPGCRERKCAQYTIRCTCDSCEKGNKWDSEGLMIPQKGR